MVELIAACEKAGYGKPVPEFHFSDTRKWRFDLAWPELNVAFEREGGKWTNKKCKKCGANGRVFVSLHRGIDGLEDDAEKYNAAAVLGWRVIRATPPMLKDKRALTAVLGALRAASQM